VVARWPGYDVAFPAFRRGLDLPYAAISSERLASVLAGRLRERTGSSLLLGRTVVELGSHSVRLEGGELLEGRLVIDARGPTSFQSRASDAYQKFLGLELELGTPTRLTRPLLMDARVVQTDGFRFFYVLPLDPHRVLLEETFFSDRPELDVVALCGSISGYAAHLGLDVARVRRQESGVLPLPTRAAPIELGAPLRAGYAGGWFHPTTGYSFPAAARLAAHVARQEPEAVTGPGLAPLAAEQARQLRFACFLNRLLFSACAPESRVHVLERFYRLPEPTIRRFYALTTNLTDRTRIVCGKPPRGVAIGAAISRGVLS
jgi:lycopene beta-cyclase